MHRVSHTSTGSGACIPRELTVATLRSVAIACVFQPPLPVRSAIMHTVCLLTGRGIYIHPPLPTKYVTYAVCSLTGMGVSKRLLTVPARCHVDADDQPGRAARKFGPSAVHPEARAVQHRVVLPRACYLPVLYAKDVGSVYVQQAGGGAGSPFARQFAARCALGGSSRQAAANRSWPHRTRRCLRRSRSSRHTPQAPDRRCPQR